MEGCLKLVPSNKDKVICILFSLVLLLAKADLVFKKKYSKENFVRTLGFGNGKIIFILLTKIAAFYKGFTTIHVKKPGF